MKSTYKLLGAMWDRLPSENPGFILWDCTYSPLGSKRSLFDTRGERRFIPLSHLFSLEDPTQLSLLVERLKECSHVALVLDYVPTVGSLVNLEFFIKRANQMRSFFADALPDAEVRIMTPLLAERLSS